MNGVDLRNSGRSNVEGSGGTRLVCGREWGLSVFVRFGLPTVRYFRWIWFHEGSFLRFVGNCKYDRKLLIFVNRFLYFLFSTFYVLKNYMV